MPPGHSNYDVDNFSYDDDDSVSEFSALSEQRDEVQEIHNRTSKETRRVFFWKLTVTGMLIFTAVALTFMTYKSLYDDQDRSFRTAYQQFSRSVAQAAVNQQVDLRDAYVGFSKLMSVTALATNASWPFFTLASFESIASNVRKQSGTEVFAVANFVEHGKRAAWDEYANATYKQSIAEGHMIKNGNLDRLVPMGYTDFISSLGGGGGFQPDRERPFYFPVWSHSPPPFTYGVTNWNLASLESFAGVIEALRYLKNETVASLVQPYASDLAFSEEEHKAMHSELTGSQIEHPHSLVFHPIHRDVDDPTSDVVAITAAGVAWDASLRNLLPENVIGILVEIANTCNQSYTYEIRGKEAYFHGDGLQHDPSYDDMKITVDLSPHTHPEFARTPGHCRYFMHIYPTKEFENGYHSRVPIFFSTSVAVVFLIITTVFFTYDVMVWRRTSVIVETAARSSAIITSLFPGQIRDRVMHEGSSGAQPDVFQRALGGGKGWDQSGSEPLADLFLETTILFADIVGFTAWSSAKEPGQVFKLLESLFVSFDELALKRRVFKVETVGDCYVAVTGLPKPRKDHAVLMARFAYGLLDCTSRVTRALELSLGPNTSDLLLRIGIHSGPVTAGVLRGERTRFQLFGDAVNTAARIESTGSPGAIHISKETAQLLLEAGKGGWVTKRTSCVVAKGKGEMETYWLDRRKQKGHGALTIGNAPNEAMDSCADNREERLLDWNAETLCSILAKIVSCRKNKSKSRRQKSAAPDLLESKAQRTKGKSFLDEVQEIISLPEFDDCVSDMPSRDPVSLSPAVLKQVRDYVATIASLYRRNQFHNFEHASHVMMSATKLMSRIIAPTIAVNGPSSSDRQATAATLHDHTYGITSDPLTQFACAFSAIIHDVDHSGVPNSQLIKENAAVARLYNGRSIAEQNSLEISWSLLMSDSFAEFRNALIPTKDDFTRFRQLVVNMVLATDIVDKELKTLRNDRWKKAFASESGGDSRLLEVASSTSSRDATNRKATIVIEHLIQASDVSHTMQHWHVYRKWNERLFMECYEAYKGGRADSDPKEGWYKGELGFFDFYIIPLAKKLKECGVFGKASGEYLDYATRNRQEWEVKGKEIVAEMTQKANRMVVPENTYEEGFNFATVDGDRMFL